MRSRATNFRINVFETRETCVQRCCANNCKHNSIHLRPIADNIFTPIEYGFYIEDTNGLNARVSIIKWPSCVIYDFCVRHIHAASNYINQSQRGWPMVSDRHSKESTWLSQAKKRCNISEMRIFYFCCILLVFPVILFRSTECSSKTCA